MTTILSAFNNHFLEFLEDVENLFPQDRDIKKAKSALEMLKKANPRAIILIWKEHIAIPYKKRIEDGDITFFLEKDYSNDISKRSTNSSSKILDAIERFRTPIQNMGEENKSKTMKYIQNLTKLSFMYN